MEILDVYNENHEYLGICEKELVHKLGLWHEVFNGILVNKTKNTIIFQIKNKNHNGIHEKDMIEISVGGHYISGEKLKDGIREIKEETSQDIKFSKLIYLGERQVSIKIRNNYIIREFQKMFIIPYDGEIKELKSQDNEVKGFIEIDIDDCILLLLKKKKEIIGLDNNLKKKNINLKNFVQEYLKGDELFLRLVIAAKRYTKGEDIKLIRL